GVLRIPCGNRREDICPPCSDVYKGDARQIIRSGLTGGKGIPETVATHPCVFATLTAPGFGPVHHPHRPRGRRLAIRHTRTLPSTGKALTAHAVANYIAKYAPKTTTASGLPARPVHSAADIDALACHQHYKHLIATTWALGKDPAAAQLGLNRWTHTLGYRGHFLTKSRRYSTTFTALRRARIDYPPPPPPPV